MRDKIDQAMARSRQYWFDDGLSELVAGVLFVLIGALGVVEIRAPQGSTIRLLAGAGAVVTVGGGFFLASWIVKKLKARFVFPRTGYVRYRRQQPTKQRKWASGLIAAVVSASIAAATTLWQGKTFSLPPIIEGVVIGLILGYIGRVTATARFYALGVTSLALGLVIGFSTPVVVMGIAYYFSAMGVVLILAGSATFVMYLRGSDGGEAL